MFDNIFPIIPNIDKKLRVNKSLFIKPEVVQCSLSDSIIFRWSLHSLMVAKFPKVKCVKISLVKIDSANFFTNSLKSACVSTVGLMSKYYVFGS